MNHPRAITAVLLALAMLAGSVHSAEVGEAIVEVATVSQGDSAAVMRLPGTVLSIHDAEISAEVAGRLTWVAEVGEQIAQGEPLAIIDDHLLKLQLRNDWAQIERLKADIEYNQRQIGRLQRLAEQNNTSRSGLDEVESRLQMLQQEQRIAEVNRDQTVYDLGRARVRAPFSGIIASREVTAGEYTEPGDPLLRLVDTGALEISVNAPLRAARYNTPGATVNVESDSLQVAAQIRAMIPVGDSQSRMMELRLTLEPGHWYIGEAVTVELPSGASTSGLSVPRDALVLRDNETYVYTLSQDNKAIKVPVTTGAGHGAKIAITGALEPGALVVVRGAERLRDGQAVKVTQRQTAGKAAS
jgi:RND family efflux transporter MFP subunit